MVAAHLGVQLDDTFDLRPTVDLSETEAALAEERAIGGDIESNAAQVERRLRAAQRATGADGPPFPVPSTYRTALTRHIALMMPATAALLNGLVRWL